MVCVLEYGQGCHVGLHIRQPAQDNTGSGLGCHIKFLAAMNSVRTLYAARQLVKIDLRYITVKLQGSRVPFTEM